MPEVQYTMEHRGKMVVEIPDPRRSVEGRPKVPGGYQCPRSENGSELKSRGFPPDIPSPANAKIWGTAIPQPGGSGGQTPNESAPIPFQTGGTCSHSESVPGYNRDPGAPRTTGNPGPGYVRDPVCPVCGVSGNTW